MHPGAEPEQPHGEGGDGNDNIPDFGIVLTQHTGRSRHLQCS